jgi:hypothetical protein
MNGNMYSEIEGESHWTSHVRSFRFLGVGGAQLVESRKWGCG